MPHDGVAYCAKKAQCDRITNVGFWTRWFGGGPSAAPVLPVSPWAENDLEQLTLETFWNDTSSLSVVTREIAQRVPGLKRALGVHLAVTGRAVFREYNFETPVDPQPAWLTSSASGVSPYMRKIGLVSDLYWWGWTCLGAELGPNNLPIDAIHVPMGMWKMDPATGVTAIDESIPARYRERAIVVPLGMNGVLVDGVDTIRAARDLEAAHLARIANPIAQTELHINNPDTQMSKKEQRALAKEYNEQRRISSTSVTPYDIDVKEHGQVATDLFESGRNAIRLDLANHAWVPASVIEGAKNGSAGELEYNNASTERNGIYDFGSALFISALEARFSMDDVCEPEHSIRGDVSNYLNVPTPTMSPALED